MSSSSSLNGKTRHPGSAACQLSDTPEVVAALEEYVALLEAGKAPDRRGFLDRHPGIAKELAECLEGLEYVRAAGPSLGRKASAVPSGHRLPPARHLGDYRILAEIARGGMGVVYEAEQVSLGRRVALKVLPFAASLDRKQLRRFQHEAQAAAHLHHPNIVPVHAVGCERNVHFYVMELVQGETLAELIRRMRAAKGMRSEALDATRSYLASQNFEDVTEHFVGRELHEDLTQETKPVQTEAWRQLIQERSAAFFRQVAAWGEQAALGLEHAHRQGVVHRDIKPANIIIDQQNTVRITDFGLARFQIQEGLTATGDLLGTLRYMSPEQSLARRGVVDRRTDVYSLGVTLYELLTLEPAVTGKDRPTILKQLATSEPVPPRKLVRQIPVDLETIILKAISNEPQHRYQTALSLAEDLKRFRMGEPILAQRPGQAETIVRWAKRHPTLVRTSVGILLLLLAALLTASAISWQREREILDSLRAAEERQKLARKIVDDMFVEVAYKWTVDPTTLSSPQRDFLNKSAEFYEQFSEEVADSVEEQVEVIKAHRRLGLIYAGLGNSVRARSMLSRAVELAAGLAAKNPQQKDLHELLVLCQQSLEELINQKLKRQRRMVFEGEMQNPLPGPASGVTHR